MVKNDENWPRAIIAGELVIGDVVKFYPAAQRSWRIKKIENRSDSSRWIEAHEPSSSFVHSERWKNDDTVWLVARSVEDLDYFEFEIWSTGLESWEHVREAVTMHKWTFQHCKTHAGVIYDVYRDDLGRWFRAPRRRV